MGDGAVSAKSAAAAKSASMGGSAVSARSAHPKVRSVNHAKSKLKPNETLEQTPRSLKARVRNIT